MGQFVPSEYMIDYYLYYDLISNSNPNLTCAKIIICVISSD